MNKIFTYALVAASSSYAALASADVSKPYYAKVEIGHTFGSKYKDYTAGDKAFIHNKKPSNKIISSLEFGYKWHPNMRLGLEAQLSDRNYHASRSTIDSNIVENKQENAKIRSSAFMLNGYYDFHLNQSYLVPYVTAGAGIAHHKMNYTRSLGINIGHIKETESYKGAKGHNAFAWQVGMGTYIPLNETFSLDFAVKYYDHGKTKATFTDSKDRKHTVGTKVKGAAAFAGVAIHF